MTKHDVRNRADIELLLTEFYKVVPFDAEIGHHFADLDLDKHIPVIADFWEKMLFDKPVYFNNPLVVHQKLHEKFPLEHEHFARWIEIFHATIDALFAGEVAELAKGKAVIIGRNLDQRLNGGVSIQR